MREEIKITCACYDDRPGQTKSYSTKTMKMYKRRDSIVVESKQESIFRLNDRSDIDLQLSKIPVELYPAVNRIALKLASVQGWECSVDFNFISSEDSRAAKFTYLALVAMGELQDFCMDVWGTSLNDLVDEE